MGVPDSTEKQVSWQAVYPVTQEDHTALQDRDFTYIFI